MWAFRDGHLSVLFNPDSQSSDRSHRPPVTVQLDEDELRAVLDALEPIRAGTPEARTRTGQLAHLLLALDVIATARRANDPTDARPTAPAVVAASLEMLSRDIAHPWTLEELSRQMFVGRSHLRAPSPSASDCHRCTTLRDFVRNAPPRCSHRPTCPSHRSARPSGGRTRPTSRDGFARYSASAHASTASGTARTRRVARHAADAAAVAQRRPRTSQHRSSPPTPREPS